MTDLTTRGIPGDVTVNKLGEHGEIVGTTGDPFDQHAGYYLYRG